MDTFLRIIGILFPIYLICSPITIIIFILLLFIPINSWKGFWYWKEYGNTKVFDLRTTEEQVIMRMWDRRAMIIISIIISINLTFIYFVSSFPQLFHIDPNNHNLLFSIGAPVPPAQLIGIFFFIIIPSGICLLRAITLMSDRYNNNLIRITIVIAGIIPAILFIRHTYFAITYSPTPTIIFVIIIFIIGIIPVLVFSLRQRNLIKAKKYGEIYLQVESEFEKFVQTKTVEPLIIALRDKKIATRLASIKTLGRLKDARSIEPLIALLKDKNKCVRDGTSDALTEIGETAVESLIYALSNGNSNLIFEACTVLGRINNSRMVKPLIEILEKDRNADRRVCAAYLLGKLGDKKESLERILTGNEEKDQFVRAVASSAISSSLLQGESFHHVIKLPSRKVMLIRVMAYWVVMMLILLVANWNNVASHLGEYAGAGAMIGGIGFFFFWLLSQLGKGKILLGGGFALTTTDFVEEIFFKAIPSSLVAAIIGAVVWILILIWSFVIWWVLAIPVIITILDILLTITKYLYINIRKRKYIKWGFLHT